jgi:trehalose 6-phosphate synthase
MSSPRLVVVSNRVAVPTASGRPGGLAVAMSAALKERGGVWFGWNGEVVPDDCWSVHRQRVGNVEYVTLGLTQQDCDDYYDGFANRTLWPLFHFRPSLVDLSRASFDGYCRVNELMAERLSSILRPEDVVWVHDYHLIPMAKLLRERGVTSKIGFFLHTPLPPRELLLMLPMHFELFGALAQYDLLGFHTPDYAEAFRGYAKAELGASEQGSDRLRIGARTVRLGAFPISIDTSVVSAQAERAANSSAVRSLRASLEGRSLLIGVDRLDYSKGLPERFKAYGDLLKQHPEWRRRVSYLQIAPTSRGSVSEYRAVRKELERIAGSINGAHAEADWVPLRYVNKAYQLGTLSGYYRLARVGLVTPLRDGMNLVAKEYVASQDPDDPGALVLSRFAGAARELDAAVLVNPYDVESMAESMHLALTMTLLERKARWRSMMDVLVRQDIEAWRSSFLSALMDVGEPGRAGAVVADEEVLDAVVEGAAA